MFDTGELLMILLVAFLVFGPKRLPELAKTLGKLMYEIREGMRNATVEIKKEYEDLEKKEREGGVEQHGREDKSKEANPASAETKDKE